MSTPSTTAAAESSRSLAALPIATFDAVMALAVLSTDWEHAAHPGHPAAETLLGASDAIAALAVVALLALGAAYASKCVVASGAVRAEFNGPDHGASFASFLTSLLLVANVIAPVALPIARALWSVGAVGIAGLLGIMVIRWLRHIRPVCAVTPVWLVPVVGLLEIPIALPRLGWGESAAPSSLACVVLGFALTLPLLTLIGVRLSRCPPLPDPTEPSLLVLVSPFAVGFTSLLLFTHRVTPVCWLLYLLMLPLLIVVIARLSSLPARAPFKLSWWIGAFPLASATLAAFRFAELQPSAPAEAIAWLMLTVATLTTASLLVLTVRGLITQSVQELRG